MSEIKLTLGMATADDSYGVWSTIQSLRLYHADVMDKCELVVVDNKPDLADNSHSSRVRQLMSHVKNSGQACQYIQYGEVKGTSAPRNKVFEVASGEFVICMDSHILLWPKSVRKLLGWIDANGSSRDLITGPMVYDGLKTYSTHFNDQWRGGMWGTWAFAWACPCGFAVATRETEGEQNSGHFVTMETPQRRVDACPGCGRPLRPFAWAGHEPNIAARGLLKLAPHVDSPATEIDSPGFEIPACGLGLFGCRKEAWLGFNDKFRGFGGEEWYIHEKFRRAGAKCFSFPWLRWNHRYGYVETPPGPRQHWLKIRNYVIGHTELGFGLDRVRKEFSWMHANEWDQLAANPDNPPEWPVGAENQAPPGISFSPQSSTVAVTDNSCHNCENPPPTNNLSEWIPQVGRHSVALQKLMATVGHVTDSRQPKHPATTDLMFIGWCRTTAQMSGELCRVATKSRRWIAIYGTDTGPVLSAISNFLNHEKHWRITMWERGDGGLVIMSCLKDDRPEEPIHLSPPGYGPGTELKAILASLGITPSAACDCNAKSAQMDMWGIKLCKQNRDMIVGWLKEGAPRWGWLEGIKAAALAVATGLAFKLNILDPFPGLIDEAIIRAELKKKERDNAEA